MKRSIYGSIVNKYNTTAVWKMQIIPAGKFQLINQISSPYLQLWNLNALLVNVIDKVCNLKAFIAFYSNVQNGFQLNDAK